MEEKTLYNISSSPHFRSKIATWTIMYDVILALMPATIVGIWHFGLGALVTVILSIASTCITEYVFDFIAHKPNTLKDGSAVVTGLLLALVMPAAPPIYVPIVGGIFAALFVKAIFGGLGKNFMNPALGARCFLLISFGTAMTNYETDAVTGATPLAVVANGGSVKLSDVYLGLTTGCLGCCALALILGGIYLLAVHVITWHIPVSMIASFAIFEMLLGHVHSWQELLVQIFAGGVIMGAFFMATDYVTSPMTPNGQLLYGAFIGMLCSLFRVYGSSADSVSYAIIFTNLLTPLIDKYMPVPKPMGYGIEGDQKDAGQKKSFTLPKSAVTLCVITLIAGVALGCVNFMTRDTIALQEEQAKAQSYLEVTPGATAIVDDEAFDAAVEALNGEIYGGGNFGKAYVNGMYPATDDAGNIVGYAVAVTTMDGFDGEIDLSVGIDVNGAITGISFTTITETAGMGMNADTPEWKGQFEGVTTDAFTLNKSGNATADNDINTISGASITSGAVVNAVNAALDFYHANVQ